MANKNNDQKKQNIPFIRSDDMGWFNVGCYNHGIMVIERQTILEPVVQTL